MKMINLLCKACMYCDCNEGYCSYYHEYFDSLEEYYYEDCEKRIALDQKLAKVEYTFENMKKLVADVFIINKETKESYPYLVYEIWRNFTAMGKILPKLSRFQLEDKLQLNNGKNIANPSTILRASRLVVSQAIKKKVLILIPSELTLKRRKQYALYCKYVLGRK